MLYYIAACVGKGVKLIYCSDQQRKREEGREKDGITSNRQNSIISLYRLHVRRIIVAMLTTQRKLISWSDDRAGALTDGAAGDIVWKPH